MVYTKQRLRVALRIIREARAKEHCKLAHPVSCSNYEFRRKLAKYSLYTATQRDGDSFGKDVDEYNPTSGGRRFKKATLPKSHRQKRKAEDEGDEPTRKKCKGKPRSQAERDSTDAYITVVLTSDKGKDLLRRLGHERKTDVTKIPPRVPGTLLAEESQDPLQREIENRRNASTYEAAVTEECAKIDNSKSRALRNRQVSEIVVKTRGKTSCQPSDTSKQKCRDRYLATHQDTKTRYVQDTARASIEGAQAEAFPHQLPTPPPSVSDRDSNRSVLFLETRSEGRRLSPPNAIAVRGDDPKERSHPIVPAVRDRSASLAPKCGRVFQISTPWAHPINFKFIPSPTLPACDFCSNSLFGITGLGLKNVQVLKLPDENGYHETGDGHRASGQAATRMCIKCSLTRLRITGCLSHDFGLIPGVHRDKFPVHEYSALMNKLRAGRGDCAKPFPYPMCSLCPLPAFSRCCALQKRSMRGELLRAGREEKGCGLLVCSECVKPIQQNGGLLTAEIMRRHAHGLRSGKGRNAFFRADAEFLYPDSLLARAYKLNR